MSIGDQLSRIRFNFVLLVVSWCFLSFFCSGVAALCFDVVQLQRGREPGI